MRTIPFRVVCLIGLNDGAFPRARRPLGFDHMAERPQAGDRTARDDDRYLFLEALLAARERLLITYVGQSISDNSDLPPSVVVSELLDAIDSSFHDPAGGVPRARIVQRHALQPFSPRYFGRDPTLFSYASTYHAGAVALVSPPVDPPPLLSAPMSTEPFESVALDDLVRFFDNPSRWFLQQRLGIYLGRDGEPLDDREPIELGPLEQWRIGDLLLHRVLSAGDPAAAWPALRASGTLPLGAPGRCAFEDIAPQAAALASAARAVRGGERLALVEIDLRIDGVRLSGVLRDCWPGGQIVAQYSKVGGRQEIGLWIRHLAYNAAHAPAAHSVLIGRPAKGDGAAQVRLTPADDPLQSLAELLRLFRLGQRTPLPFFRFASRAFAETLRRSRATEDRAWREARKKFGPDAYGPGDANDEYVAELYPKGPPFAAGGTALPSEISFADAARAVFDPFFRHRTVVA